MQNFNKDSSAEIEDFDVNVPSVHRKSNLLNEPSGDEYEEDFDN